ncbi:MAG: endonuclease MutS2 [Gemmatimonadaceae bacterium]|nr:endonuclease MutS2 [Gemmatimonadaceae bacterium]
MNTHALAVLEFPAVLDVVAQHASSPLGAARVRAAAPVTDRAWIEAEHARVAAMRALVRREGGWAPEPIPDLEDALGRLRAAGSVWRGEELLGGALLLRSSRLTRDALRDERRASVATAVLAPFAERLVEAKPVEAAIERAIERDGTVKDDASPALRRIRRELRGAEAELVQLLERIMARLEPHHRVPDMSVTVRNGRYVIPVRREARGAVGGIVHDQSATRGTLFVEPPAAIEAGNRIRELEAEEQREVERILLELTDALRPMHAALTDALDVLVTLDALYARARFAERFQCASAELATPREGFAIRNGRHPLLLARGGTVVPFDLVMDATERTLLLSGPNTGGKTVLLKAVGLISALVQAGVPAPVGAESRVPVYDECFADIGDEQSIEASLSTFSAHLRNLGEILAGATADSLVLIDELGSGTDPAEGAALGGAILEELTRRGTRTVATTHLGALKLLATEVPGIVNASLQFDEQALEPTYRLIKGIPGRSYGLSIARRLRLPPEVLARAEERLSREERDVAALLTDLERREVALAEREARAAEEADRAAARLERVTERERALRAAERTLEQRARQQARQYLLDARAEVERAVREIRESGAAEEVTREARRRVEAMAARQSKAIERIEEGERRRERASAAASAPAAIAEGDVVEVGTLGGRSGQVVELRGDDAVVAVGALKVTVPRHTLTRTARARVAVEPVPMHGELPDAHAPTEIDLRGMRVDEMEHALLHALDDAVRADLKELRIIHGKGTGALRERVAELLRGDPRVRGARLGAWNEGGAGVTVAELH